MSCQFFPSCSTIESRCATRGSLHDWIIEQHFLTHKPIYKCLDIVIVRKLPRRNLITSYSVPSAWVFGVALVSGPSTETCILPFPLRRSIFQRLSAGQIGAYSLPARPRQIIST